MANRIPTDPAFARTLSAGSCHLYVLPCMYEDILKLGHSRDPLVRMQTLHPRYFDFFDLDTALLVRTDTVREARALELQFGRTVKLHNAPSPLVVRRAAAGHTEWYRGALEPLSEQADTLERAGYTVHKGLRPWLRGHLLARSDRLYEWATQLLDQAEPSSILPAPARPRAMRSMPTPHSASGSKRSSPTRSGSGIEPGRAEFLTPLMAAARRPGHAGHLRAACLDLAPAALAGAPGPATALGTSRLKDADEPNKRYIRLIERAK